jgi:predicted transposase YbfD/YdcC
MTLTEAFAGLPDPRTGPAQRHDLREMILMALCAVMSGAEGWDDMEDWGQAHETWLRQYLRRRDRSTSGSRLTDAISSVRSPPTESASFMPYGRIGGIENGLHGRLDITLGEDASPIQLRNAALNFSLLRRIVLNLFRADASHPIRLQKKRKATAWNPDYLATLLKLQKI